MIDQLDKFIEDGKALTNFLAKRVPQPFEAVELLVGLATAHFATSAAARIRCGEDEESVREEFRKAISNAMDFIQESFDEHQAQTESQA